MAYSIAALSEDNIRQWDDFNNQSLEGTLFHSTQWMNILKDSLKLKLRCYLILEDQRVVGICPFVEKTSMGIFRGLIGLPHSEFNNIILDGSFDISQLNDILSFFSRDYSFLHLGTYRLEIQDYLTYRNLTVEDTGNMMLDLKQSPPEAIWSTFSRNMRQNIQIFEKNGFEIREVHQPAEIETFYQYYAKNIKHINGDILPFSFFQRLLESYPDRVRIAVLANDDTFAGGSLSLSSPDRKTAYYQYLALNRDLPNKYTPTYPIYWDLVNWAWNSGHEKLSFGRQGLDLKNPRFQSKAKFGAEYVPIHSRLILLSRTTSLAYQVKRLLSGIRIARIRNTSQVINGKILSMWKE